MATQEILPPEPADASDRLAWGRYQRTVRREWRHERATKRHELAIRTTKARDDIPVEEIVRRLARNAMGTLLPDEPPMTQMEVRAAAVLLKKVMPDLEAMALIPAGNNAMSQPTQTPAELFGIPKPTITVTVLSPPVQDNLQKMQTRGSVASAVA